MSNTRNCPAHARTLVSLYAALKWLTYHAYCTAGYKERPCRSYIVKPLSHSLRREHIRTDITSKDLRISRSIYNSIIQREEHLPS